VEPNCARLRFFDGTEVLKYLTSEMHHFVATKGLIRSRDTLKQPRIAFAISGA
jgi:hypothetical protein